MFCPKCGTESAAAARFCTHCGTPLAPLEDIAPAAAPAAESIPNPGQSDAGGGALAAGTTSGLQRNVAGLLCYVLGWLTGIIFYLVEKDPFVRFHAMQSILTFGGVTAVYIVIAILLPMGLWRLWFLFHTLGTLLWLASIVLWVLLMVKAYQGERYKLPVVGELAERYAGGR